VSEPQPEPIRPGEAEAFIAAAEDAFHGELAPEDLALELAILDPVRALAIRDGERMVATAAVIGRELTVPGGASVATGAVTAVGVQPDHTRRGHLRRLMIRHLADMHAAGEPLSCLWSSEAGIYSRYGYGSATQAVALDVRTPAPLRADAPVGERARLVEPDAAVLAPLYEAARRPGMLSRTDAWWQRRIAHPEHRRGGSGDLRCALVPGGYALYAVAMDWGDHGPDGTCQLKELVAGTPEATAGLWRHLLGLDLVHGIVSRLAAAGDPLPLLVANPDAVAARVRDGLWLRLVDVEAALAARTYATPFSLAIEVEDTVCPWNAGLHRLAFDGSTATCEPAQGEPELVASAEALGAAYLGGTSLALLAAAGQVRELRPGALRTAAVAFREPREPWCPEIF
jgi:predicted acetyltransferase